MREARAAAEKAQQLLQNVANRKRNRQSEIGGLVITKAIYGNQKDLKKKDELNETNDESSISIIDVTLPLNFLVNDSGQLKVFSYDFFISCVFLDTNNTGFIWKITLALAHLALDYYLL